MRLLPGFLLLCMSWLQPMHLFPWLSWHSELVSFAATLLMGWEIAYRGGKRREHAGAAMVFPASAVPLLILVAIVILQWSTRLIDYGGDVIAVSAYITLCCIGLSAGYMSVDDNRKLLYTLACTLVVGSICSAFIAFAQVFEVWDTASWIHRSTSSRRPGANLGQPNQLATLLLMGLAGVVYLFERRRVNGSVAALLSGVLLSCLAVTESKSGMLSFIMLTLWWVYKQKSVQLRVTAVPVAAGVVAYLLLFLSWPLVLQEVFQYKTEITAFNSPTAFNRFFIWPQLLKAAMLHPWLGWGFGQVAAAHNAVVDAYPRSEAYTHAHNIVLDFSIGLGIPLTTMFVLMLAIWLWRRASLARTVDHWYCLALLIPIGTHSMFEYPYAYSYFLLPVMLAVGALERQLGEQPVFRIGTRVQVLGLALATVLLGYSSAEYLSIEEDFRIVRFQNLRVGKVPEDYQPPKVRLFTQLEGFLGSMRTVPRPQMSAREIEITRLAAVHFPMIATQNRYALSLALNGNADEAIRQLAVMRSQQAPETYIKIKAAWLELADTQYSELRHLQLPQ